MESKIRSTLFIGGAVLSTPGLLFSQEKIRPNIILIMSDDMGYSDIEKYGGVIHTPNLNKLAEEGVSFRQFYNTARSCPTRASLLTGLHPHQAGIGHMMNDRGKEGYRGDLSSNSVTIAEVLKSAGYKNYAVGKWHVTSYIREGESKHNWPLQRGFDKYYGILSGAASYYDPGSLCRDNTLISPFADKEYHYPQTNEEDYYLTEALGDNAVKFIKEHEQKNSNNPFFMYVTFTAAHWPMQVPERYIKPYYGKFDKGWDQLRKEKYQNQLKEGIIDSKWVLSEDSTVTPWDRVEDKKFETRCMEVYAGMISCLDHNIGKIVEELRRTGQLDNTVILFLQDNGACAETVGRERPLYYNPIPEGKTLGPMQPDELQTSGQPWQTREGQLVRRGYGVLPGGPDTYIAYGKGWAYYSNTPFREYKHWVHEGGISTPLIIRWTNGIKSKGAIRQTPGQLPDILATLVDISGAVYPKIYNGNNIIPLQGVSLKPAFEEEVKSDRYLFWEHENNKAIRQGRWKLVYKFTKEDKYINVDEPTPYNKWELYDIENDRTEIKNLASKYPEKVKQLADKWERIAWKSLVKPYPEKKYF
ncbi:arylsulfatase [Parabacteroides sp. Marseille-P3160]|uniref:arylsulfatase n=1 Tax=Parabacteroides sp. Marseille-P3160 TaxID=1917887 RepID=UPI0009BABFAF|nr:arylsulfatase [Parabacteroides sp. Marseille-P3160]